MVFVHLANPASKFVVEKLPLHVTNGEIVGAPWNIRTQGGRNVASRDATERSRLLVTRYRSFNLAFQQKELGAAQ